MVEDTANETDSGAAEVPWRRNQPGTFPPRPCRGDAFIGPQLHAVLKTERRVAFWEG